MRVGSVGRGMDEEKTGGEEKREEKKRRRGQGGREKSRGGGCAGCLDCVRRARAGLQTRAWRGRWSTGLREGGIVWGGEHE